MRLEDIKPFKVKITDTRITEEVELAPVKHGRWNKDATCSVCGEGILYDTDYLCYCPNCGAKMERSEELELKKPTIADGVPPEVLKAAEELGEYIGKFIETVMEAVQGGEIWRD